MDPPARRGDFRETDPSEIDESGRLDAFLGKEIDATGVFLKAGPP